MPSSAVGRSAPITAHPCNGKRRQTAEHVPGLESPMLLTAFPGERRTLAQQRHTGAIAECLDGLHILVDGRRIITRVQCWKDDTDVHTVATQCAVDGERHGRQSWMAWMVKQQR